MQDWRVGSMRERRQIQHKGGNTCPSQTSQFRGRPLFFPPLLCPYSFFSILSLLFFSPPPRFMFRFTHETYAMDDVVSEKSASAIAYRRRSIPQINSAPSSSVFLSSHSQAARRPPLAPLDPQATTATYSTVLDDQMSMSSSSPSFRSYTHLDAAQDRERAADLARSNICRPIISNRNAGDDSTPNLQGARRRSIPNQYVLLMHKPSRSICRYSFFY